MGNLSGLIRIARLVRESLWKAKSHEGLKFEFWIFPAKKYVDLTTTTACHRALFIEGKTCPAINKLRTIVAAAFVFLAKLPRLLAIFFKRIPEPRSTSNFVYVFAARFLFGQSRPLALLPSVRDKKSVTQRGKAICIVLHFSSYGGGDCPEISESDRIVRLWAGISGFRPDELSL